MTREEAIKELKIIREDYWDEYDYPMPALDMAIKALEQESSEDCVSREALLAMSDYIGETPTHSNPYAQLEEVVRVKDIEALPPVQPKQIECEDAISRAEIVQFLENHSNDFEDIKIRMAFQAASSLVNNSHNLPSVYPKPKTGHWIPRNSFLLQYRCSECGWKSEKYNYCPNCGADMSEVTE